MTDTWTMLLLFALGILMGAVVTVTIYEIGDPAEEDDDGRTEL